MNTYPKGNLIGAVRDAWDGHDQWGTVMMWWFGIADVLWHNTPQLITAEWQYRHGAGCNGIDRQEWPDGHIADLLDDGIISIDEMLYVGIVLTRYAGWLKLAGQDY